VKRRRLEMGLGLGYGASYSLVSLLLGVGRAEK